MLPFASKTSDSIAIFTNTRVPAASECGNSRKHPCKLSSLTRVLCGRILRSNFGAGVKRKCPTWGPQDSSSLIVDFAACRNEQKTVRLGCLQLPSDFGHTLRPSLSLQAYQSRHQYQRWKAGTCLTIRRTY